MIKDASDQSQQAQYTRVPYFFLRSFLILISIGINSTIYSSIPFIFYQSQLECIDSETNKVFKCSYQDACELQNYRVAKDITQYLDLFCDRSILELYIFTSGTLGRFFANICLVLFPIQRDQKEMLMNTLMLFTGICLCLLQFISSLEAFIICFFIWYFCFSYVYVLAFIYIEQFLPLDFQNEAIALTNMAWPVCSIIYVIFAYYFGHWKSTLIYFVGLPSLIISICNFIIIFFFPTQQDTYLLLKNSKKDKINEISQPDDDNSLQIIDASPLKKNKGQTSNICTSDNIEEPQKLQLASIPAEQEQVIDKPNQKNQSFFYKYFPFMFYSVTRKNFCIWTFCCASVGMNYASCYYFLNQIQGNLYINSLFSTMFEVFASFISTIIVVKFPNNLKIITNFLFLFTGLAFISLVFLYKPNDNLQQTQNYLELFLVVFPIIIAKVSFDIGWVVLVSYLKKIIPVSFQQQQFSTSNQIHAFVVSLMPSYRYICIRYSLNPFVGLGVISLIASLGSLFFTEINENDENFENHENQKESKLNTQ